MPYSKIKQGDRFGMLTVIRRVRTNYALYRCNCGKEKEIQIGKVTGGWTKSCGCLMRLKNSKTATAINAKRRQTMIGRAFGRLTVIGIDHCKPAGRKGRRYYYKVKCKCGTEKIVLGSNMVKGGTKSCGCLKHESRPARNKLPKGEAAFRCCYRTYKIQAQHRKLPFELNENQFRQLVTANCHYCDEPPSNTAKHPHRNGNFVYNGIDRVDNQLGYTAANTVPCCRQCNHAKYKYTIENFLTWAARVAAKAIITLPSDKPP